MKREEIPTIDEDDLTCCSRFEELYLIGKVLGKTIPLKNTHIKAKAK